MILTKIATTVAIASFSTGMLTGFLFDHKEWGQIAAGLQILLAIAALVVAVITAVWGL